jgi:hypothetical protein
MIAGREAQLYAAAKPTLDPVVADKLRTVRARIEDRAERLYFRQDTCDAYDLG